MTLSMSSFFSFLFFLLGNVAKGQYDLDDIFREAKGVVQPMSFDVMRYNAVSDGKTDNSQQFLNAWNEACNSNGKATVTIPPGTFKLFPLVFKGPCKGPIEFNIKGTLIASSGSSSSVNSYSESIWIAFQYVDQLTLTGGGTLDGQGASAWGSNDCAHNSQCKPLPTSLSFRSVTNSTISDLTSLNSKNTHIKVYACKKLRFRNVRITAPKDSPNTDGIKIGNSHRISISRSIIQTGDDCVAILSGCQQIHVTNVMCGPGHGISIGSLGGHAYEEFDVRGIYVTSSVFKGSDNGVRIKTYSRDSKPLTASNITYQDLHMIDVKYPIVIDQQYCPNGACNQQGDSSNVQISDVTYRNIWGTSSTKDAVTLRCSKTKPCKNIQMEKIKLPHSGPDGLATTVCQNVVGKSIGSYIPPPCL